MLNLNSGFATTYRRATNCSKSITWSRFLFFSCCCDFFRCLRKSKTLEEASLRLNHMNNFGKKLADEQYQHRKIIATVVYNSFRNSNVDSKSRLDTCMELVTKKSMQTKPKLIQFGFMTHRINHAIS